MPKNLTDDDARLAYIVEKRGRRSHFLSFLAQKNDRKKNGKNFPRPALGTTCPQSSNNNPNKRDKQQATTKETNDRGLTREVSFVGKQQRTRNQHKQRREISSKQARKEEVEATKSTTIYDSIDRCEIVDFSIQTHFLRPCSCVETHQECRSSCP